MFGWLLVLMLAVGMFGAPARRKGRLEVALDVPGGSARHLPLPVMAGTPTPAKPVVLPPLKGAAAKVIKKRVAGKKAVFLCDDSGSMYPMTSGDATGIRYASALSLVNLIRDSGGGTFYVIHWGSDAPDELVFANVDVKDRKTVKRALSIPPTLGGNNLPLALHKARAVTRPRDNDERFVYLVISDGIEDVSAATHMAIASLPPSSVHMVLVDRGGGCSPAMEAQWKTAGFASVTRLNTFNTRQMAHQLAELYADSIGLEIPEASTDHQSER